MACTCGRRSGAEEPRLPSFLALARCCLDSEALLGVGAVPKLLPQIKDFLCPLGAESQTCRHPQKIPFVSHKIRCSSSPSGRVFSQSWEWGCHRVPIPSTALGSFPEKLSSFQESRGLEPRSDLVIERTPRPLSQGWPRERDPEL